MGYIPHHPVLNQTASAEQLNLTENRSILALIPEETKMPTKKPKRKKLNKKKGQRGAPAFTPA